MAAAARRHGQGAHISSVAGRSGRREGIESIMSTEVVCVREGAPVAHLRTLLVERGQHCVPVVTPDGRPVGIVTQTDLLRSHVEGEGTAGEIMTPLVFALPVTASIEQAAALMAYEGVEQIVVTSMGGQVAGLVRALDVARRCARSAGYLVDRQQ
jgi:CBS-domain-containing membrane protein